MMPLIPDQKSAQIIVPISARSAEGRARLPRHKFTTFTIIISNLLFRRFAFRNFEEDHLSSGALLSSRIATYWGRLESIFSLVKSQL